MSTALRCQGIVIRRLNTRGSETFDYCAENAAKGHLFCESCIRYPVRQFILRALLPPDWQVRQSQAIAAAVRVGVPETAHHRGPPSEKEAWPQAILQAGRSLGVGLQPGGHGSPGYGAPGGQLPVRQPPPVQYASTRQPSVAPEPEGPKPGAQATDPPKPTVPDPWTGPLADLWKR